METLEEAVDVNPGLCGSEDASARASLSSGLVSSWRFDCPSWTGSLAVVCSVVGFVLSLLMAVRHGNSLLCVWLVEGCPAQFPAGPWLRLSFLKTELTAEFGSSPNRLSAERTVNGRLLLLLQFTSASFFPMIILAGLLSSSGLSGTFGLSETLERSVDFLLPVEVSVTGGEAWKNLCRADCVFWAEAVQDLDGGGAAVTGFTTTLTGADSTDDGHAGACVRLALFNRSGPFWILGSEEEGL